MAKKAEHMKAVKIVTEKGVAVYPRLNVPDTKFKKEGVYSVRLRIPAEQAQALCEKIDAMAQVVYDAEKAQLEATVAGNPTDAEGKKAKVAAKKTLSTFKLADKAYKMALNDDGDETGEVEFNFKMNAQYTDKNKKVHKLAPSVVDTKGTKIDAGKVWGGSTIKIGGFLSPFFTATVGAGVSLKLDSVCVIKLVSGGGASQFDFGSEEGYVADEKDEDSTTDTDTNTDADTPAAGDEQDEF